MKSKKVSTCSVSTLILAISLCVTATGFYNIAAASDWPNYRGPDYNGFTKETDWKSNWGDTGPKVLWKKSLGMGFSSMVVVDGRVYAMGNRNKDEDVVYCLDAATGNEIWTHSYPCPLEPKYYEGGTLSTPTVDGDRVYTLSKMGSLFCLNTANGKVIWHKELNKDMGYELPMWHFSSSALVVGDMIVLNIGDAGLALNKHTGSVVWSNGKEKCGYATPVPFEINGQRGLAIFGKNSIIAVSPKDGKKLWEYPWVTKHDVNAADPIIFGNYVFITSGYNRGCTLLEIDDGKATKVWESRVMRTQINCCVRYGGFLYGFDESTFKCINLMDGTEKWTERSLGKGSLMMSADGRMIIMSDKGELVIARANPQQFKPLARAQVLPKKKSWTTPVLANGKIYARNAFGDMVCVEVGD